MARPPQTYANHRQVFPLHHLVLAPLSLITLIVASVTLVQAWLRGTEVMTASLLWLLAFMMVLAGFIARRSGLVAQDRAICTAEDLRHFILTGKPLDSRLDPAQIIALRFAADAEFTELAMRAAETGLKPDEIKRAVKVWRPDYHRV